MGLPFMPIEAKFPLIRLPKKPKDALKRGFKTKVLVSINSTSEEA